MSSALRRVVVHNHVPARKRARARDAATATYEVWYIDRDGRRKMASVTAESQLAAWAAVRRATGAKQLISAEMARGGARDAESGRPFGGVVQEGGKWYFYDPDSGEQRGPFDWKSQAHEAWSRALRKREACQIGRQTYPGRGRDAGEVRIVHNRMLGGWYVVRGPQHTPISGRFDSKEEAMAWLSRRGSFAFRSAGDGKWQHITKSRDAKVRDTRVESGLKDNEPRVVTGLRGTKSRPFSKRFANAAAMERWMDSDEAGDVDIQEIKRP